MSTYFEEFGGTYHEENGYLIPDLIAPETPQIGVWGRRYLHHLKTAKRVLYTQLLFSEKLAAHPEETERCAEEMMDRLMEQIAVQEGGAEPLKAENQMERVKHINSDKSRAEEIVWAKLIIQSIGAAFCGSVILQQVIKAIYRK